MRNAIRSEVRKILSTRSVWLLLLIGLVVEVVSSFVGIVASKSSDFPASLDQISFLHFGTTNVCLLFVILGIRAVGDEFAYDTITPSLQVDSNRPRLLAAKALTYAGAAALYAVVALGILVFHVPFRGNPFILFGMATLFLLGSLGLGIFISAAIKSPSATITASK